MVLMVVLNFQNVIALFGSGGLLASLILVILSAAGGYLLGGLGGSHKWVQALGAGQRNIAAAMVVATMNFGSQEIVMTPLALELGKRRATAECMHQASVCHRHRQVKCDLGFMVL